MAGVQISSIYAEKKIPWLKKRRARLVILDRGRAQKNASSHHNTLPSSPIKLPFLQGLCHLIEGNIALMPLPVNLPLLNRA